MRTDRILTFSKFFLFFFLFFLGLRIIFFAVFKESALMGSEIIKALFIGIRFDLRLAAFLVFPLALLNFSQSKNAAKIFSVFYCVLFSAIIITYIFDLGFYAYLRNRINISSLTLLEDSKTAWAMIWESYPVIWCLSGLALGNFLLYKLFIYLLNSKENSKRQWIPTVLFTLMVALSAYGSISRYPLRWSEAIFSKSSFINSLGLNPILYFIDTYSFRNEGYDQRAYKNYYKQITEYYGNNGVQNKLRENVPNVVVIVMESMASHKTSLMNNPLDTTPHLKSLAQESIYFDRYYVPVESTARSMFAIMTSIPDVSLSKSASRNPLIAKRHLIMDDFKGHDKYYFLGGSANWGQIRSVFNNVEGIKIFEEGSYESPVTDVWGISDLDLSKEAEKVLSQSKKPFFAVIQFASFHRPYTIPQRKDDFSEIKVSKEELSYAGFYSNEQLNSLRFSDYALGEFFKRAKKSKYYGNTIFVVTGDHGLPDEGAGYLPKAYKDLFLGNFHVPLVIHAPGIFKEPKVHSTIASEVDVMPTIASLAGINFKNEGLGLNLFAPEVKERFAFTYFWYNTNYNLISDKYFLRVNSATKGSQLLDIHTGQTIDDKPLQEKMFKMVNAFYESSRFLLFKNMHLTFEKK